MFIIHINVKSTQDLLKIIRFCREEDAFTYEGQFVKDDQRYAVVTTTVEHGKMLAAALV